MKVIIAGGRDFNDFALLTSKCTKILSSVDKSITIVSGTAKGADSLGEQFAIDNNYNIHRFIPDWNKHGKAAGLIRNKQMAEYSDGLIAFWDGKSRGTAHMINTAREMGLKVRVIRYEC